MARPQLKINAEDVEKLAAIGCTLREIAAFCNCSEDTIERRYAEPMNKGREKGKTRLRRSMWQAVDRGNITMMIWLSKQILGMREKIEQTIEESSDEDFDSMSKEDLNRIIERNGKK
jgi:hypothetical protein